MSVRCFVDSNVFVYRWDARDESKQARAASWIDALWPLRAGRVSAQVLHEVYVTTTRKLEPPVDPATARAEIRALRAWGPEPLDTQLLDMAWEVERGFGLHFWDALIVAAAQRARCTVLLSEDLQDGQDLGGVTVVDPFVHEPGAMLR